MIYHILEHLHSLAFRKLGLKKEDDLQEHSCSPDTTKTLGKKLGFPVTYADYQEDQGGIFTSDSEYLENYTASTAT